MEFGYLGKGKAPNSIHTQGVSLAPNGINPKDSLAPKGIHNLKLPLPFMCLTGNRKGAKSKKQAVSFDLILLSIQNPENQIFIIPVKNGSYLHFFKVQASEYRIPLSNINTASSIQ